MPPVPRPHQTKFPNAGTDRRPDELKRHLESEERAVETDRVADEDRLAGGASRQLVNILALAVLALSIMVILLGTMLAIAL
jgi:hypothetical protein